MKKDRLKWLLLSPIIIYALILILLPIVYIFILSFQTSGSYGEIIYNLTFYNYIELIKSIYLKVFLVSFGIASITTIICMIIAFPFSYFLREKSARTKTLITTLVMLPFLTNSLIRLYGWIVLLRKTGIVNTLLMNTGITDRPLSLMYNTFGTCVGMVYTLLPFMILPLISACEKIDNSLIEAAHDLGASNFMVFMKIVLPTIMPAIVSGATLAFTLSLDDVVISYFTAGPGSNTLPLYIYSMIKTGITPDVNALSSLMMLVVFIVLISVALYQSKKIRSRAL